MATTLGSLILELGLDDGKFQDQVRDAKNKALLAGKDIERNLKGINASKMNLHLEPTVNDEALTALNAHLDLKRRHFQEVNRYFKNNKLTVNADSSDLDAASDKFDILQRKKLEKKELKYSDGKIVIDQSDLDEALEKVRLLNRELDSLSKGATIPTRVAQEVIIPPESEVRRVVRTEKKKDKFRQVEDPWGDDNSRLRELATPGQQIDYNQLEDAVARGFSRGIDESQRTFKRTDEAVTNSQPTPDSIRYKVKQFTQGSVNDSGVNVTDIHKQLTVMTKHQLTQIAKLSELKGYSSLNKAELVNLLSNPQNAANTAKSAGILGYVGDRTVSALLEKTVGKFIDTAVDEGLVFVLRKSTDLLRAGIRSIPALKFLGVDKVLSREITSGYQKTAPLVDKTFSDKGKRRGGFGGFFNEVKNLATVPARIITKPARDAIQGFFEGIGNSYGEVFAGGAMKAQEKKTGKSVEDIGEAVGGTAVGGLLSGTNAVDNVVNRLGAVSRIEEGVKPVMEAYGFGGGDGKSLDVKVLDQIADFTTRIGSIVGKSLDPEKAQADVESIKKSLLELGKAIVTLDNIAGKGLAAALTVQEAAAYPKQAVIDQYKKTAKESAFDMDARMTEPANAPRELKPGTKRVMFVSAGFAGKQGMQGHNIAETIKPLVPETTQIVPFENREFDVNSSELGEGANITDYAQWGSEVMNNMLKIMELGYNPAAVRMAQEAYAYSQQNPEVGIDLVGHSAGGIIAREAQAILKQLGVESNVLSIATPLLGAVENQKDDAVAIMGESDLMQNINGSQPITAGVEGHAFSAYAANESVLEMIRMFSESGVTPELVSKLEETQTQVQQNGINLEQGVVDLLDNMTAVVMNAAGLMSPQQSKAIIQAKIKELSSKIKQRVEAGETGYQAGPAKKGFRSTEVVGNPVHTLTGKPLPRAETQLSEEEAEQITFFVGGFGGTHGLESEHMGTELAKMLPDHMVIAVETPENEIVPGEGETATSPAFLKKAINAISKDMNYEGDSAAAERIAERAYMYHLQNPDKPINLVGQSGGGMPVRHAADILKALGVEDVRVATSASPSFGAAENQGITMVSPNDALYKMIDPLMSNQVRVDAKGHSTYYSDRDQGSRDTTENFEQRQRGEIDVDVNKSTQAVLQSYFDRSISEEEARSRLVEQSKVPPKTVEEQIKEAQTTAQAKVKEVQDNLNKKVEEIAAIPGIKVEEAQAAIADLTSRLTLSEQDWQKLNDAIAPLTQKIKDMEAFFDRMMHGDQPSQVDLINENAPRPPPKQKVPRDVPEVDLSTLPVEKSRKIMAARAASMLNEAESAISTFNPDDYGNASEIARYQLAQAKKALDSLKGIDLAGNLTESEGATVRQAVPRIEAVLQRSGGNLGPDKNRLAAMSDKELSRYIEEIYNIPEVDPENLKQQLTGLTKAQLTTVAKKSRKTGYSKLNKADLIDFLSTGDNRELAKVQNFAEEQRLVTEFKKAEAQARAAFKDADPPSQENYAQVREEILKIIDAINDAMDTQIRSGDVRQNIGGVKGRLEQLYSQTLKVVNPSDIDAARQRLEGSVDISQPESIPDPWDETVEKRSGLDDIDGLARVDPRRILSNLHSNIRELIDPARVIPRKYKESVVKNAQLLPSTELDPRHLNEAYNQIPETAKQVVFVSAGFSGTKGQQANVIAENIKPFAPEGSHVVPFHNATFDVSPNAGPLTWVKDALTTTGGAVAAGGNQDALQLARQVFDLKQANPDVDVKLMGHSAGGLIIREAQEILKGMGIFVDALSIGTPLLGVFKAVKSDAIALMGEHDALKAISGQKEGIVPGVRGHESKYYAESETVQKIISSYLKDGITPELIEQTQNLGKSGLDDVGGLARKRAKRRSRHLELSIPESIPDLTSNGKITELNDILTNKKYQDLSFREAFDTQSGSQISTLLSKSLDEGKLPDKQELRTELALLVKNILTEFISNPVDSTKKGLARQSFVLDISNVLSEKSNTVGGLAAEGINNTLAIEGVRDLIQEGMVGTAGIVGSALGSSLGPEATLAGDLLGALLVRKVTNDINAIYEAILDGANPKDIVGLIKAAIDKKQSPEAIDKAGTNYKQDFLGWAVGNTGANVSPLPLDGAAVAMYSVPDSVETGTNIGENKSSPKEIATLSKHLLTKWLTFGVNRVKAVRLLVEAEQEFIETANENIGQFSNSYQAELLKKAAINSASSQLDSVDGLARVKPKEVISNVVQKAKAVFTKPENIAPALETNANRVVKTLEERLVLAGFRLGDGLVASLDSPTVEAKLASFLGAVKFDDIGQGTADLGDELNGIARQFIDNLVGGIPEDDLVNVDPSQVDALKTMSVVLDKITTQLGGSLKVAVANLSKSQQRTLKTVSQKLKTGDTTDLSDELQEEFSEIIYTLQASLAEGVTNLELPELDFLDEMLRKNRNIGLQRKAVPLAENRAKEILDGKRSQTYRSDRKGNDAFVVTPDTKELFIAVGGMAGAKGISGAAIKKTLKKEIPKDAEVIWTANPDSDVPAEAIGTDAALQTAAKQLAKPHIQGYSPDAIEMAAQALAAVEINPEVTIKLVGESGGGNIAEEAYHILKSKGLKNVEYIGVGTPNLIGGFDKNDDNKVLSVDEHVGENRERFFRNFGLANTRAKNNNILGVNRHRLEYYREAGEANLSSFIKGKPEPLSKDEVKSGLADVKEFVNLDHGDLSLQDLNTIAEAAFANLQMIRQQLEVATDDTREDLQEMEKLFSNIFVKASGESSFLQEVRQLVSEKQSLLANITDDEQGRLAAEQAKKELKDIQARMHRREGKVFGTKKAKIDGIDSEINNLVDQFNNISPDSSPETQQETPSIGESLKHLFSGVDLNTGDIVSIFQRELAKSLEFMKEVTIGKIKTLFDQLRSQVGQLFGGGSKGDFNLDEGLARVTSNSKNPIELAQEKLDEYQQKIEFATEAIFNNAKQTYSDVENSFVGQGIKDEVGNLVERGQVAVTGKGRLDDAKFAPARDAEKQNGILEKSKKILEGLQSSFSNLFSGSQLAVEAASDYIFKVQQTYENIAKEVAELSGVELNFDDIPRLIVDDEMLEQIGADAFYDIKENSIIISEETAKLLANAENLNEYSEHLKDIIHELRHATQLEFGKRSLAQISSGNQTFATENMGRVDDPEQLASVDASIDVVKERAARSGYELSDADVDTIRRAEEDAYNFESNASAILQKVGKNSVEDSQAKIQGSMTALRTGMSQLIATADEVFPGISGAIEGTLDTLDKFGSMGDMAIQGFLSWKVLSWIAPKLADLAMVSLDTARTFEQLNVAMGSALGGSNAAATGFAFVRSEVDRLNTDLISATKSYIGLASSTQGTELQGEATNQIFSATQQAISANQLNPEEADRVGMAIQQIASKGVVSSEELRQQLSESLPGAFQIAARSMGMTVVEFNKMLETGSLLSEDFLPRFAQQLSAETANGVVGAANSAQGAMNRFNNELLSTQAALGTPLLTPQKMGLNLLSNALNLIQENGGLVTQVLTVFTVVLGGAFLDAVLGGAKALLALLAKMNLIPAAAATIKGALGLIMAQLKLLMAAFAKLYLITEVIEIFSKAWDSGKNEIYDFARQAEKSMDTYIEALDRARAANESFTDSLPENRRDVKGESFLEDFIVGDALKFVLPEEMDEQVNQGFRWFEKVLTGNSDNRLLNTATSATGLGIPRLSAAGVNFLRNGEFRAPTRAEATASQEAVNREDLLTAANATITQAYNQIGLDGKGANELGRVIEIDSEVEDLQARRRGLMPQDTEQRKALDAEIDALRVEREKLSKPIGILQQKLSSEQQALEQQLVELDEKARSGSITREDYETQYQATQNAIEANITAQEKLNALVRQSVDRVQLLAWAFEDVNTAIAESTYAMEIQIAQQNRMLATATLQRGTLNTGITEGTAAIVMQQQLGMQIQNNRNSAALLMSELTGGEVGRALTLSGIQEQGDITQVSPEFITSRANRMAEGPEKEILLNAAEQLSKVQEMTLETENLLTQIEESKVQLQSQIDQMTLQLEDMMIEIGQQAEMLEADFKAAANDRKIQSAARNIGRSMKLLRTDHFSGFMGLLEEFVNVLGEQLRTTADFLRQKIELSQNLFNQLRQNDMFNLGIPQVDGGVVPGGQGGQGGGQAVASPLIGQSIDALVNYQPTPGQSFTASRNRNGRRGSHAGIDWDSRVGGGRGADVAAAIGGRAQVIDIGEQAGDNGNAVQVRISTQDAQGIPVELQFNHLELNSVREALGIGIGGTTNVTTGQMIGEVINHHLDMKVKVNGEFVDAQQWLAAMNAGGGTARNLQGQQVRINPIAAPQATPQNQPSSPFSGSTSRPTGPGRIPRGGTVSRAERVQADSAGAQAIVDAARQLGLDPREFAALMSWESAGSFNPNIMGGDGNQYKGLIQFSPSNQERYGTGGQQSIAQQMPAIVRYLIDRGFQPGQHDIRHAYSAILAGNASERYWNRRDSNGTSVRNAAPKFQQGQHRQRAEQFLRDSGANLSGSGASFSSVASATPPQNSEFERFMREGYALTQRRDYQSALINFRRAAELQPNNRYAAEAIRNVTGYINQQRSSTSSSVQAFQNTEVYGPPAPTTANNAPATPQIDVASINAQSQGLQQTSSQYRQDIIDLNNQQIAELNRLQEFAEQQFNLDLDNIVSRSQQEAVVKQREVEDAQRLLQDQNEDRQFNATPEYARTPEMIAQQDTREATRGARDEGIAIDRQIEDLRFDMTEVERRLPETVSILRGLGAPEEFVRQMEQAGQSVIASAREKIAVLEQQRGNVDTFLTDTVNRIAAETQRALENTQFQNASDIANLNADLMEEQATRAEQTGDPQEAARLRKGAEEVRAIRSNEELIRDLQQRMEADPTNAAQYQEQIDLAQQKIAVSLENLNETFRRTSEEIAQYNFSASRESSREVRALEIQQLRSNGDPMQALVMEQEDQLNAQLDEFQARRLQIAADVQLDEPTRTQLLADLQEIEAMTIEMTANLMLRAQVDLEIANENALLDARSTNLQALIPNLNANYEQGRARDMQAELDGLMIGQRLRETLHSIEDPSNNLTEETRERLRLLAEETAELEKQNLERNHALQIRRDQIEIDRNTITNPGGPQALAQVQDEYLGMFGITPTYAMKQERLPMQLEMQNLNYQQQLLDLEELRNSGKLTQEAFEKAKLSLEAMNNIKLDQLRIEASGIPEIVNSVKGPMQGFFKEMLDPNSTKTFGEAFSDMINGMLANLASLAAEWVTNSLFSSFLGGGAGSPGKEGGLFSTLFGGGEEEGAVDPALAAISVEGDPATALAMGGQEASMNLTMGAQEAANMLIQAGIQFAQSVQSSAMSASMGANGGGYNWGGMAGVTRPTGWLEGMTAFSAPAVRSGGGLPGFDMNNLNFTFARGAQTIGNSIIQSSSQGANSFGGGIASALQGATRNVGSLFGGGSNKGKASGGGLLGGLFSGGGGGGIFGSLLQMGLGFLTGGFNTGGVVTSDRAITIPNFAKGGKLGGIADNAITEAFKRERPYGKPRLIMANEGEWVLNRKQQAIAKSMGVDERILNFAGGGIVGSKSIPSPVVNTSNIGGTTSNVSVPITINGGGGSSADDDAKLAKQLKEPIEGLVRSILQRNQRFGGDMYRR